jgi:hypothetical protein
MELQINDNCCTDEIKIHPVKGSVYFLSGGQYDKGVHIFMDKRQLWKVYYYRFADTQGWVVRRGIVRIRMPEKDFNEIFGDIEIIGRIN